MNTPNPNFEDKHQGSVSISIAEFENLIQCKKELIQIKNDLKLFLGDDL